jgi:hypothetical protein
MARSFLAGPVSGQLLCKSHTPLVAQKLTFVAQKLTFVAQKLTFVAQKCHVAQKRSNTAPSKASKDNERLYLLEPGILGQKACSSRHAAESSTVN